MTQNSATISWTTSTAVLGGVSVGTTASYGKDVNARNSNPSTSHSVTLLALNPATTYHYRAFNRGTSGTSADATFTTLAGAGGSPKYSTHFSGSAETVLSEGGAWVKNGGAWAQVRKGYPVINGVTSTDGVAYGTQTGGAYDDSYAHLTGFPPDQAAYAVVHKDANFVANTTREVEVLLRWGDHAGTGTTDDPPLAYGYECNLAHDGGYAEIVRWNGALGDYTYIKQGGGPGSGPEPGKVHDGAVFRAEIRGNLITTYLDDIPIWKDVDVSSIGGDVFKTGDPGMAFWRGSGGSITPGDYGFTQYTAVTLDPIGPAISTPTASALTQDSVTISWTTSTNKLVGLDYGPTAAYGKSVNALNTTASQAHSVTLIGLNPATTYHYRVTNRDGSGTGSDTTFTTLAAPGGMPSYNTDFGAASEFPISEGGAWTRLGSSWTPVNITRLASGDGVAHGTQSGAAVSQTLVFDGTPTGASYLVDDSYAHLTGYPPDQTVTAVIHRDANFAPGGTREVEILLRWNDHEGTGTVDDPTLAYGYECNIAYDGSYAEIGRWDGRFGTFESIKNWTFGGPGVGPNPGQVHDGAVFKAEIRGKLISTWLDGVPIWTNVDVSKNMAGATLDVLPSGNPGMGFWRGTGASLTPGDYGFTSFSAGSL